MDIRLTGERLRNHLDANQGMREGLCLALMPLIGPYTQECPRRPKGGPDGGRDIEAIYQGTIPAWGAIGFRNGGGNDNQARKEAADKFEDDLKRALKENAALQCFVFFTNVDLTPSLIDELKGKANKKGVAIVDIVAFEQLRHLLDLPEGLLARLQYLDIPMSKDEQLALIHKFGGQLQNAVSARFDRVEQTLAKMERFLDYQKPLYRFDVYIGLEKPFTSSEIGNEHILLSLSGVPDITKTTHYLLSNWPDSGQSKSAILHHLTTWIDDKVNAGSRLRPMISPMPNIILGLFEVIITSMGNTVRISDLADISLSVYATSGIAPHISKIIFDANGYELYNLPAGSLVAHSPPQLPDHVNANSHQWFKMIDENRRELLFSPPNLSGRLAPVHKVQVNK